VVCSRELADLFAVWKPLVAASGYREKKHAEGGVEGIVVDLDGWIWNTADYRRLNISRICGHIQWPPSGPALI
jgi:hypothetical protein